MKNRKYFPIASRPWLQAIRTGRDVTPELPNAEKHPQREPVQTSLSVSEPRSGVSPSLGPGTASRGHGHFLRPSPGTARPGRLLHKARRKEATGRERSGPRHRREVPRKRSTGGSAAARGEGKENGAAKKGNDGRLGLPGRVPAAGLGRRASCRGSAEAEGTERARPRGGSTSGGGSAAARRPGASGKGREKGGGGRPRPGRGPAVRAGPAAPNLRRPPPLTSGARRPGAQQDYRPRQIHLLRAQAPPPPPTRSASAPAGAGIGRGELLASRRFVPALRGLLRFRPRIAGTERRPHPALPPRRFLPRTRPSDATGGAAAARSGRVPRLRNTEEAEPSGSEGESAARLKGAGRPPAGEEDRAVPPPRGVRSPSAFGAASLSARGPQLRGEVGTGSRGSPAPSAFRFSQNRPSHDTGEVCGETGSMERAFLGSPGKLRVGNPAAGSGPRSAGGAECSQCERALPKVRSLTLCERPKGVGNYRAEKISPLFCATVLALKSSSSPQPPSLSEGDA